MLYLVYAAFAGLATITSGLLPFHPKVSKVSARYVIAFASGVVVATSLFEMLPEANPESNWVFIGLGFFLFYLIERVIMIHHGEAESTSESIGWPAIVGISADNLVDGLAIAIGYLTDPTLGLFIAGAVIVHEVPQGLTTTVIMKEARFSFKWILGVLCVASMLYPIGALVSTIFPSEFHEQAVAFVAGEFIFIGAGELLPEAHRRFNIKVILMVIFGAILIALLEAFAI